MNETEYERKAKRIRHVCVCMRSRVHVSRYTCVFCLSLSGRVIEVERTGTPGHEMAREREREREDSLSALDIHPFSASASVLRHGVRVIVDALPVESCGILRCPGRRDSFKQQLGQR